jgi:hypothetical protein
MYYRCVVRDFAHLTGLNVHLLEIQIYFRKANNIKHVNNKYIALHRVGK